MVFILYVLSMEGLASKAGSPETRGAPSHAMLKTYKINKIISETVTWHGALKQVGPRAKA
jgi:hypothetical protein